MDVIKRLFEVPDIIHNLIALTVMIIILNVLYYTNNSLLDYIYYFIVYLLKYIQSECDHKQFKNIVSKNDVLYIVVTVYNSLYSLYVVISAIFIKKFYAT